ncbi:BsuPI-related putative proteinase inhibitor [Halovivax cerinus]|uniref:Intracellular proteinase inhibitor BsuPI domain-containing protein n=1 Tax=Halovivax cerinus TaxID=1487865 RepID=A0ABD5NJP0_9EURY|nr:BsuPI-related putative proteinase inhibitor [Halovivax cerinus]
MTLEGSLDAATDDDSVTFTLTVENTGSEPTTAQFSDGCRVDVAVYDGETEIWRYTDGMMFMQVLGQERFEPGDPRTFEVTWDDPTAGTFTAVGELTATDRSCEARTDVSI